MKKLKLIINRLYKTKYQNSLFFFEKNKTTYFSEKETFYNELFNTHFNFYATDDDLLIQLKKYVRNNDDDNLLIFYKKFCVNLNLRKKYLNKKAITKKFANIKTVIYLAYNIIKIRSLNNILKLNFVIKVNDYFIINYNKNDIDEETRNMVLKLFKYEKKHLEYLTRWLKILFYLEQLHLGLLLI